MPAKNSPASTAWKNSPDHGATPALPFELPLRSSITPT